jgi:hypothetical protein
MDEKLRNSSRRLFENIKITECMKNGEEGRVMNENLRN